MDDVEHGRFTGRETEGIAFPAISAAVADPLITAIGEFRRGMAAFDRHAPADDGAREGLAERTFRPALAVLHRWNRPAMSREGALAALKLAEEGARDGDGELAAPMIKAAICFLEAGF